MTQIVFQFIQESNWEKKLSNLVFLKNGDSVYMNFKGLKLLSCSDTRERKLGKDFQLCGFSVVLLMFVIKCFIILMKNVSNGYLSTPQRTSAGMQNINNLLIVHF